MCYAASSVLVKAGIAMTLLRLTTERKYRWPILAVLVFTPIFTITVVLVLVITCKPVGAQFDLALGSCPIHSAMAVLSYPFTAMTIILDWGCALIPWLIIRDLHLNRRVKKGLIFVLGLGALASIGAIARMPFLHYYTIYDDQLCKSITTKPCYSWTNANLLRMDLQTTSPTLSSGQYSRMVLGSLQPPCRRSTSSSNITLPPKTQHQLVIRSEPGPRLSVAPQASRPKEHSSYRLGELLQS